MPALEALKAGVRVRCEVVERDRQGRLVAKEIALRGWGLPECLHVPVAAVDENAIRTYVGEVLEILSAESGRKALLVKVQRPDEIDHRLPIWQLEASSILHQMHQVWVHIGYSRYRSAYKKAFPDENITNKIMSHALNRRIAALKGLQFVRITPTSYPGGSGSLTGGGSPGTVNRS